MLVARNRETGWDIGRRGLLHGFGFAGLGVVLWRGLGSLVRPAYASAVPVPSQATSTMILEFLGPTAVLRTGPFLTFPAAAGARVGVCLMTAGAIQGRGPLPLISSVGRAYAPGAFAVFEPDSGVERSVYRLSGALSTPRPLELFGLSAEVDERGLPGGSSFEITWEVELRGGGVSSADLASYLEHFQGCVIGGLAPDSTFQGHLSYVEISRRPQA